MSNDFKRLLAYSHNGQPAEQIQQNRQSIISPQLQLPSRKSGIPITEQVTDVHGAFPPRPPFTPLPAYSEKQVMTFSKITLFTLLLGLDLLANMLELTHVNFLYTTT